MPSPVLLALALVLALSPILREFAGHVLDQPWTAYALPFPFLLWHAAARSPREAPRWSAGLGWIAAALVLELIAVGGGVPRMGRPAIALAVIGWLRVTGLAPLPVALLALWLIPLPKAVSALASPGLERTWQEIALRIVPDAGRFPVAHWDGGVRIVAMAAGLGWWAAVRQGGDVAAAFRRAAAFGALGLPLQVVAMILATALVSFGHLEAAHLWLLHGVWIVTLAGALSAEWLRRPRPGVAHAV